MRTAVAVIRLFLNDINIPQGAQNFIFTSWRDLTLSMYSTYATPVDLILSWTRQKYLLWKFKITSFFLISLHIMNKKSYSTIHTAKCSISYTIFFSRSSVKPLETFSCWNIIHTTIIKDDTTPIHPDHDNSANLEC